MRIVFFKRPKPKRFEYKPRYWDEEKERLEERKKHLGEESSERNTLIRDINLHWRKIDRRNRNKAKSINLVVYLFIILLLLYFIFKA
ncbi:MAG: hypothetical protein WBH71_01025 [Bacteroidales bacterium]|jgi:hypothetical protein|nr:hypothetical protein [Bacteroidales bacterium]MDI9592675.1 hypothetical protein [Bacteroidota bacterium]NLH33945.1 hypothetical protein [Lentimicrobium sp.]OQC37004.1 MAG: hypothetical protein BWX63_01442 [Bacteroidetes bacterium ADurb.Bin041]MBP7874570.1 hypothetical protein [Bacteroidales bacterium]